MIAQAKAHPNTLSLGIPGVGTTSYLVIEALMHRVGGKMLMVPYRGTPPLADIENGLISVSVSLVSSYVSQVQDGTLHAVAVSTAHRDEELPNVPTVEGLGYPGFDFSAWLVLVALPRDSRAHLQKDQPGHQRNQFERALPEALADPRGRGGNC